MSRRNLVYVIVSLVIGIFITAVFTELSFRFVSRANDRSPETITLVIPAGTAAKVALGEQPTSIPADMTFVVGDTLVVNNEDYADHQLGPLFIPAGTKASMTFNTIQNYAYSCTFTPTKYIGLDIKEPLALSTRILGVLSAGLPLGTLIALYVVFAIRPGEKKNRPAWSKKC
jgi:hypothetical protein